MEDVDDRAGEVFERNPAHVALSIAEGASEAKAKGEEHFLEGTTLGAEYEADSEVCDADPFFLGGDGYFSLFYQNFSINLFLGT